MPVPHLLAAFLSAFLPLFVAINIPGILPLYIGMTEALAPRDRARLLVRALAAAFTLAVAMLFAGEVIFRTLGITVDHLRVGGGLILLTIAVSDLAFGTTRQRRTNAGDEDERTRIEGPVDLPIVPLGIPLIIGPGAITTILLAGGEFGWATTLLAIGVNLTLVWIAFTFGPRVLQVAGRDASKAIAKVASLFLAAIAVAMISAGVEGIIRAAIAS